MLSTGGQAIRFFVLKLTYGKFCFVANGCPEILEPPLHEDDWDKVVFVLDKGSLRGQDHVTLQTLHINFDDNVQLPKERDER